MPFHWICVQARNILSRYRSSKTFPKINWWSQLRSSPIACVPRFYWLNLRVFSESFRPTRSGTDVFLPNYNTSPRKVYIINSSFTILIVTAEVFHDIHCDFHIITTEFISTFMVIVFINALKIELLHLLMGVQDGSHQKAQYSPFQKIGRYSIERDFLTTEVSSEAGLASQKIHRHSI